MSLIVWKLLVLGFVGFIDIRFMHNIYAALGMVLGSCLVGWITEKLMYSACENEGPFESIWRLWLHIKGHWVTLFIFILSSIVALVCAAVIANKTNTAIYLPGVLTALIPILFATFIGGLIGLRAWINDRGSATAIG